MVLLSNHLSTHPHLVVFYSFAECEPLSSSQQVGNSPTHDHLQHIQGTLVMTAMMLRSLTRGWEPLLHSVQTPEMMFFCIFCLAGGLMEGAHKELSSTADDEKMARGRIASPCTMDDTGLSMAAANVQRYSQLWTLLLVFCLRILF